MIRLLLCCLYFVASLAQTPGWNLLFGTSVLNETHKYPLYFDNPVPKWIKGSLIRNGPARYEMGRRSFLNLFDGFGKLYSWQFPGNGSAFFSAKFLGSECYNESLKINDIAPYQTFDDLVPPMSFFDKELALYHGLDNMNINVYNFSGDCVVLSDTWKLYVVDCYTLDTVRPSKPGIPGVETGFPYISIMSVAHPVKEYGKNGHLTILQSLNILPDMRHKFTLVRTKSADVREKIAEWEVKKMPYLHSFSTTERYAIIFGCPFYIDIEKMLRYSLPKYSISFHKDEPTITYVIDLKTGKVVTMETENIFSMHHVNAYELDDTTLVMDVVSYPDASLTTFFEMDILMNKTRRDNVPFKPYLRRYKIDLKASKMTPVSFDKNPKFPFVNMLEVPTINEKYRSKHYCFVYGVVFKSDNKIWGNFSFVKKDVCNASGDLSWSIPGHYPMEGWFVPNPEGLSEDDGILMVPVLDGNLGKSYILLLDPKTMKPITKAIVPFQVPFHFHGRFIENVF